MGIAVWIVFSLRNDDSALRVVVRVLARNMGWSAPSTTAEVVSRMSKDQERGRDEDAIKTAVDWTQKHPVDPGNYWVYTSVSGLYLKKAQKDSGRKDEYVIQAIVYRDRALQFQEQSIPGLQDLASISELAADLSSRDRCPHYRNAIKLLQHTISLLDEQRNHSVTQQAHARESLTADKIKALSGSVEQAITRVTGKLQSSGCPVD